jgi:hypothetical protein
MLGFIETLLDDGVLIFQEDLRTIEARIEQDPDMITDLIKLHKFASENRDIILAEYLFPAGHKKIVYELVSFNVDTAMYLSIEVAKFYIRSKNLIVEVAYPKEDIDEGD